MKFFKPEDFYKDFNGNWTEFFEHIANTANGLLEKEGQIVYGIPDPEGENIWAHKKLDEDYTLKATIVKIEPAK